MKVIPKKVNVFIALWRIIKLLSHFTTGVVRVFFIVRHYNDAQKAIALQTWSKKLLTLLDIDLCIEGNIPKQLTNTLIVSNHISWLDILIIFTIIKPRFVAKKEIANWPVIGHLTKVGGTIFIDRNNKRDIMQVNKQLSNELMNGHCIAIFPESTTSTGELVLPFKAPLFEPIYQSKGHVLPLSIQYKDVAGNLTTAPNFAGKTSLLSSVWNVLRCHQLQVKLCFKPLLDSSYFTNRNELALVSRQSIESNW